MSGNSTIVLVQDILTNVTIHAGNITTLSTSQPIEVTQFQLTMPSGSSYVCRVNYDVAQATPTIQLYFYTYGYVSGSYISHQYIQPGIYNVS
jgi:hypothetical protein